MFGWFRSKGKPLTAMDAFIEIIYGKNVKKSANLSDAIHLAHDELLGGSFAVENLARLATDLNNGSIPYSTHDLAAAVALAVLRKVPIERRQDLMEIQMMARMKVASWLLEGKVVPVFAKVFEDTLYKDYHPSNWS